MTTQTWAGIPRVTAVLVGATAAVGAVLAWTHRWIADDGLIYLRTVRQIVAGNGPVYNVHDRVESSTGTLWQWLLALVSAVTGSRMDLVAIYAGVVLFVVALLVAAFASFRLNGARGGLLVPFGMVVVVALPPFWDFATSGLETSLTYAWIAAAWWLLVEAVERRDRRHLAILAFVIGLGPLVRPDMALVSVVFFLAIPGLRPWREKRRTAQLLGIGLALPLAYQVFRMGYYGEVVPMPAVSKGAAGSEWGRGWDYLLDFVTPYQLGAPLALVAVVLATVWLEQRGRSRDLLRVSVAPVLAAILSATYVVRMGGDFMHARMLLPALLLVLLPVFVVRVTRSVVVPLVLVAVWALVCAVALRVPYQGGMDGHGVIADERGYYVTLLGSDHPTQPDYVAWVGPIGAAPPAPGQSGVLLWHGVYRAPVPLAPGRSEGNAVVLVYLGMLGASLETTDTGVDFIGLAYPLAAHGEPLPGGRPGHVKQLSDEWILADYASTDAVLPPGVDRAKVAAARHALGCGDLRDLLEASRAPLTAGRFLDNLVTSVRRSSLTVPSDPLEAERKFCG